MDTLRLTFSLLRQAVEVHNVVPLSLVMHENAEGRTRSAGVVLMCPRHNEPLKFHCGSCDVAICGDCAAIGDHRGHESVRYIKDIVEERGSKSLTKSTVGEGGGGKLERSLQAVDRVSTDLSRRADEVRTESDAPERERWTWWTPMSSKWFRKSMIWEEFRLKILDRQKDELKGIPGIGEKCRSL